MPNEEQKLSPGRKGKRGSGVIPSLLLENRNPILAMAQAIKELQLQVGGNQAQARGTVSFGFPQNPLDPEDNTALAGATGSATVPQHNGSLGNIEGSWVEVDVTDLTSEVLFTHNLYKDQDAMYAAGADDCNVRWVVHGFKHNGTGAAVTAMGVHLDTSDTAPTATGISLRVIFTGPTVNGDNPVRVTLFFTKAVR